MEPLRIVHLTPGTGNFHCGSCLRDNHLIKALRKLGHDVVMTPLYLPLVTDDAPASGDAPLFAGGINMFLQQKFRLFRKTPRWLDKLLDAPRLLLAAVKRAHMTSAKDLGEMTLESFRGTHGKQAKEWSRLVSWIRQENRPHLVSLSNGLLTGLAGTIREDLGVPVICSLQGEDSFLDTLPEPYRAESWRLFQENSQHVTRFVATSEWYAGEMRRRLALPEEKIAVIPNGMNWDSYAPAESPPDVPTIGYLARLIKGKGLDQLIDAFLLLKQRGNVPQARLKLGGTKTTEDDRFIRQQQSKIAAAGQSESVSWHPNLSFQGKVEFLQSLSVLSVPATYGEAFGLYVIEALACGVPVVEPEHAGLAELVRNTGGGLLCEPDNPTSLAEKLEEMLLNPARANDLAANGRAKVLNYYTADRMAREFAEICRTVISLT